MRSLCLMLLLTAGCYDPKIVSGGYRCHPTDSPACPSGFYCVNNVCVDHPGDGGTAMAAALTVAKSGPVYGGPRLDPMLGDASACPDRQSEPNDAPGQPGGPATPVAPLLDQPAAPIGGLAICPSGNNPATGRPDVDYFAVDNSSLGATALKAEIGYDISYGDLDVALVDAAGRTLAVDGSARSNGCVAAAVGPGRYYVAVVGADGRDVNRYQLRVSAATSALACP